MHARFFAFSFAVVLVLGSAPMCAMAQRQITAEEEAAQVKTAAAKPTPRASDGHPDLSGYWKLPEATVSDHQINGVTYVDAIPGKAGAPSWVVPTTGPRPDPNPPPYKSDLWPKVKDFAAHEVDMDPAFHCKPLGVPRAGAPQQIVQTPKLTVLFYQTDSGAGDTPGVGVRLVPTNAREHRTDIDPMYFGDSVGHWEGDSLVVDVTHLTDDTWLGMRGYFHSTALHVMERYTRKGDTLTYEATVEDPNVLIKPWVMTPETEILVDTMVVEQPPCEEREVGHLVNGANHAGGNLNDPR